MSHFYKYAIAQLLANPMRGEKLNVAIIVFSADGLRFYPARNLEKIKAISAALGRDVIEQALENLVVLDKNLVSEKIYAIDERIQTLSALSALKFSPTGSFTAPDADSYESMIKRLLHQLVEPEPAIRRAKPVKKTRLLVSIKSAFRSEHILARKGEDIDSHRIVANRELAEGLSADLLLKNGAMHVVQTVDASHMDRAKRAIQEIGISALVFEEARIQFGRESTSPRLVYSANAQLENSITPALRAAAHQGADLVNWESRDDRTRFIVDMSSLAEPIGGQQKAVFGSVHASNRDYRKLN